MDKETFIETYGRNRKPIERYNKALRTEVPGGNQVLDLINLTNQILNRNQLRDPIAFVEQLHGTLEEIRDEMVNGIKQKYNIPTGP